jgi:hypothetical protein
VRCALFALAALAASCWAGCGSQGAAEPRACATTCECVIAGAPPEDCPGEWVCGAAQTCEYRCKTPCDSLPYTCRSEESCDGTICSEHHRSCR